MKFYHGSAIAGIRSLIPHESNHGKPYVYLTKNPTLALLYSHNPMTRPNGFFTYCWDSNWNLRYDEYFPDALKELYRGKQGYVYQCEGEFKALEHSPWIYVSETPVAVTGVDFYSDLYTELLKREASGEIQICRYSDASEEKRAGISKLMRREIEKYDMQNNRDAEYAQFVHRYFPELL